MTEGGRPLAPRGPPSLVEQVGPLVLFLSAVARDETPALLEGLGERGRAGALAEWGAVQEASAAARRGRTWALFHPAGEEEGRLRGLLADASPELQHALFERLPRYLQSLVPGLARLRAPDPSPLVLAWAERLVRELTR